MEDWCYITPYSAQAELARKMYRDILADFQENHDLTLALGDLPAIQIGDHTQSKQYRHVVYDTVVDKTLGFLADDDRVHRHLSRCQDTLIILFDRRIMAPFSGKKRPATKTPALIRVLQEIQQWKGHRSLKKTPVPVRRFDVSYTTSIPTHRYLISLRS